MVYFKYIKLTVFYHHYMLKFVLLFFFLWMSFSKIYSNSDLTEVSENFVGYNTVATITNVFIFEFVYSIILLNAQFFYVTQSSGSIHKLFFALCL